VAIAETTKPKTSTSKENRSLLTGEIYRELRKQILGGELKPAQQLRQDDIAALFGVSKIPVREALKQLEADGLVEFKPRRGAFVVELSESDILEVQEIRIALETRALELAIPNMTDNDINQAREILNEYEQVTDFERWCDLNSRFHQCIYAPCGLSKLVAMIQNVKDRTGAFMRLKVTMASGLDRPHSEHKKILAACEAGDVELGVKLLREHIERTKKEVAAHFRREATEVIN
jgi:DNA-binding GntR family transcriptional regulator